MKPLNSIYNELHQVQMELIPHVTPKDGEIVSAQQLLVQHHLELVMYYLGNHIKHTQKPAEDETTNSDSLLPAKA